MKRTVCTVDKKQSVILWISYLSYLLFFPACVGCIVSHLKAKQYRYCLELDEVAGKSELTVMASHHNWLVRTFIFVSVFVMVGIGTMFYGVGYIVVLVALLWWFFRVFQGLWYLLANKPMPG